MTKGFIQQDQDACDRMEAEHLAERGVKCDQCEKPAVKFLRYPLPYGASLHFLCAQHLTEHQANERLINFAGLQANRAGEKR